ncbi:8-amino-7-oxononanoate synthase [compost metagenome]
MAYDYLERNPELQKHLIHKIDLFKHHLRKDINLINSNTSIQSIVITGNEEVMRAGAHLKAKGFSLGVVRAPAVAEGAERLRVCLHLYNSVEEINELAKEINQYL